MPLYKTALRMASDVTWPSRRKWSTTFWINAANAAAAAAAVAASYITTLRAALDETIFAYEVYATSAVAGDEDYTVVSIAPGDQRGLVAASGRGELYLAKAVIAVEMRAAAGRPSRKFWRFGLREGDVTNGAEASGPVYTLVGTAFASFITEVGAALVDPDNTPIVDVGKLRLTTREFGRTAGADVPAAPPVG